MSESVALESAEGMIGDPVGETAVAPRAAPVVASERIESIDVLRGFAVLGILAMNIVGFFWPFQAYDNPTLGGSFTGFNRVVWIFNHIVFDTKMMTIFSMLFGAGLVLKFEKTRSKGASLAGLYYRRILVLLAIGLVHSYLIWEGDILVLYAQCGLLLFMFRKKSPKTLIILGSILILSVIPLARSFANFIRVANETLPRVEKKTALGEKLTDFEKFIKESWPEMKKVFDPDRETRDKQLKESIKVHRGRYVGIVKFRAAEVIMIQTYGLLLTLWMAGGRMMLGMGLMKLGVFEAKRSRRFYLIMAILGYGIGIPLLILDTIGVIRADFGLEYSLKTGIVLFLLGSMAVTLGHVGVWMLICQSNAVPNACRRLAAVGRMALSNYLMQSLICTTLAYGYGFGLFAKIDRTGLVLIVVAIWSLQLFLSPIWLRHFRFGPAEWLWRTITYWRLQPMRLEA